ncbi:putative Ubiquitin-like domain-containing protein [Helianthus annuus]|nr:uncharacterized protein LOC110915698 [Helianthus annuus]KAJ0550488.1 putative Ubiquitin-like domain-containing protein [Helianthus annuus]KAJ0557240.1 putative Ubiquitin-like domain-containing protein [Helianthus annuus]KAJ0563446.1 putative Ubiquitin-like domain-containing protein [Helianthus annuus]KAJ0728783.1 putative Ubiquitin-like domain-containing protein [Helianthus annuus]KAJ0731542.1 putative Ubiquitin-like domain-containing protein [Helianthus annuus]
MTPPTKKAPTTPPVVMFSTLWEKKNKYHAPLQGSNTVILLPLFTLERLRDSICNFLKPKLIYHLGFIRTIQKSQNRELGFQNSNTPIKLQRKLSTNMIEVVLNDRLGKKVRVKCNDDDTIGDLKKLVAAQTGTRADKIRIQKWYNIYKDHITLKDYEIHDGMGLELYYN